MQEFRVMQKSKTTKQDVEESHTVYKAVLHATESTQKMYLVSEAPIELEIQDCIVFEKAKFQKSLKGD